MQDQLKVNTPEPWETLPPALLAAQLPQIIPTYVETAMPWLLLKCKARSCFSLMGVKLTKKKIAYQFKEYAKGNPLPQNSIQQHPISLIVWNAILEIDLLRWYEQSNPSLFQLMFSPSKIDTSEIAQPGPSEQNRAQLHSQGHINPILVTKSKPGPRNHITN